MTVDLCFVTLAYVLAIEHWLGHQPYLKQKSIIALVLLILTVLVVIALKPFQRRNKND